ncbi:hypothetical protein NDU88_002272 [Pleurodeles waltl]|uniref:Uncharacterized protein n=1 Tax=Pleurodeles waltl TaxID=8319 RepID=A0AAV7QB79_PLEWA|nr:hypothetical protein NDU88_002272 [Pleurodeles waltl]
MQPLAGHFAPVSRRYQGILGLQPLPRGVPQLPAHPCQLPSHRLLPLSPRRLREPPHLPGGRCHLPQVAQQSGRVVCVVRFGPEKRHSAAAHPSWGSSQLQLALGVSRPGRTSVLARPNFRTRWSPAGDRLCSSHTGRCPSVMFCGCTQDFAQDYLGFLTGRPEPAGAQRNTSSRPSCWLRPLNS